MNPAHEAALVVSFKFTYGILLPTLLGISLVSGQNPINSSSSLGCCIQRTSSMSTTATEGAHRVCESLSVPVLGLDFHSRKRNLYLGVNSADPFRPFRRITYRWRSRCNVLHLNWAMQFSGWGMIFKAITNWSIILMALFMDDVGLWVLIGQPVEMYHDPNILVNNSSIFADNNIWT
jgi:hypothetical protein